MVLLAVSSLTAMGQSNPMNTGDQKLKENWKIQSSAVTQDGGEVISTTGYQPEDWYSAHVPTTVLAALVDLGEYQNIFFNKNMEKISEKRFDVPWWYRKEFNISQKAIGKVHRIRFDGINYRADVWLNGQKIASSDTLKGGFRQFTLNVSSVVKTGTNVLAVKVTHPGPGEPTLGFVDWNPTPPDHNMGIWRDVHLLTTGPVSINRPFVKTNVDTATLDRADLTVSSVVRNHSTERVQGVLRGTIGDDIKVEQKVNLAPGESKKILFTPGQFSDLGIHNPRLWWTHNLGKPNLYHLKMDFSTDGSTSDSKIVRFGIRSITDYLTKDGHRGFKLNGKKILIRGGGYTDPMLLNATSDYEEAAVDYAVQMNMNTLRFEGFWGHDQHLYDLCDEKGILVMIGWSAEWEWKGYFGTEADEFGGVKTPDQMNVAAKSWEDQNEWLRNHPSIFARLYGSDKLPRPALERKYLAIENIVDPNSPYVGAAAEHNSIFTGPTAVKMRGPYDYVPPDYWYVDDERGGAFGFNTETGPGPQIPPRESLEKMMPADSLWPISDSWLYHAARNEFHQFKNYNKAMNERLGSPNGLSDYLRKAQFLNYEGMRAMFEAFGANRYKSTGIIQWMYNSSWPKLWWQLYDYYLLPNGAFYGARKANEPLHIAYNYGANRVEVMNYTNHDEGDLTAHIKILNFNMDTKLDKTVDIWSLRSLQTKHLDELPDNLSLSKTYFLNLELRNNMNKVVSSNFYVLSTQHDKLDNSKATWYITPQSQFADLTMLQELPNVKLNVQKSFEQRGDTTFAHVTIKNPGSNLAFMVRLNLRKKRSDESVVPIFWDDNYFTLLPGEQVTINGHCKTEDLDGEDPALVISGWNIE